MHQASVGVHCPECFKGNKQKVYTRTNLPGSKGMVTNGLIAVNLAMYLIQVVFFNAGISTAGTSGGTFATSVFSTRNGEWWRIITGGFVHIGVFHLGVNMFSLYRIGPLLEQRLGPVRYFLAYMASLVGGSFGAMLIEPARGVMGASGAIFGLLGLLVVLFRSRGIGLNQSGLGQVLVLNVLITFSGFVSVGGHVGGFVIGALLGVVYFGTGPGAKLPFGRDQVKPDIATGALLAVLFVGCILIAQNPPFL